MPIVFPQKYFSSKHMSDASHGTGWSPWRPCIIHQAQGTPTCSVLPHTPHMGRGDPHDGPVSFTRPRVHPPALSYPIHLTWDGVIPMTALYHSPDPGYTHLLCLTPYTSHGMGWSPGRPCIIHQTQGTPSCSVLPHTPHMGRGDPHDGPVSFTRPRVHPPALSYPIHLTWDGVILMTALYLSPSPGYTHLLCFTPYTRPRVHPPTLSYPIHQTQGTPTYPVLPHTPGPGYPHLPCVTPYTRHLPIVKPHLCLIAFSWCVGTAAVSSPPPPPLRADRGGRYLRPARAAPRGHPSCFSPLIHAAHCHRPAPAETITASAPRGRLVDWLGIKTSCHRHVQLSRPIRSVHVIGALCIPSASVFFFHFPLFMLSQQQGLILFRYFINFSPISSFFQKLTFGYTFNDAYKVFFFKYIVEFLWRQVTLSDLVNKLHTFWILHIFFHSS